MPGIVQLVPRRDPSAVIDRLWLVFFTEAEGAPWWSRFLAPGYRHVIACAWFAQQQRWVYYNPARTGTVILLYREDEFPARLTQLMTSSALVLRVVARQSRTATPFGWWCTGAVKALLGVRGFAVTPFGLARWLQHRGAEAVLTPCVAAAAASSPPCPNGEPVQA